MFQSHQTNHSSSLLSYSQLRLDDIGRSFPKSVSIVKHIPPWISTIDCQCPWFCIHLEIAHVCVTNFDGLDSAGGVLDLVIDRIVVQCTFYEEGNRKDQCERSKSWPWFFSFSFGSRGART